MQKLLLLPASKHEYDLLIGKSMHSDNLQTTEFPIHIHSTGRWKIAYVRDGNYMVHWMLLSCSSYGPSLLPVLVRAGGSCSPYHVAFTCKSVNPHIFIFHLPLLKEDGENSNKVIVLYRSFTQMHNLI